MQNEDAKAHQDSMVAALEAVIRTGDIDDVGTGVARRSLTLNVLVRTSINHGLIAIDDETGAYYVTKSGHDLIRDRKQRRQPGVVIHLSRVRGGKPRR